MRKYLLTLCLCLFAVLSISAKDIVVKRPSVSRTNAEPITIEEVCLGKKETVIKFCVFDTLNTRFMAIGTQETRMEDLEYLLKEGGFENFSFDLSGLLGGNYTLNVVLKEYEKGKEQPREEVLCSIGNKRFIHEFPEHIRNDLHNHHLGVDYENGVYDQIERMSVGFVPVEKDTLRRVCVRLDPMVKLSKVLKLRKVEGGGHEIVQYVTRRFMRMDVSRLVEGEFNPLVLLGSMWYDESSDVFRFCGEREITPDLSNEMIQNIPHFYVIGIVPVRR